jgi:hypothetical protein
MAGRRECTSPDAAEGGEGRSATRGSRSRGRGAREGREGVVVGMVGGWVATGVRGVMGPAVSQREGPRSRS